MKCICEYLEEDYIKWADRPYISTKENGTWHSRTFRETIDDIRNLSKALLERGFEDKNLMPFAADPFGNYICFDRNEGKVAFWDHETNASSSTGQTMSAFLEGLY